MPTLLVPDELLDRDVQIVQLRHPKTTESAKFVVDGLDVFQLTAIDNKAHKHSTARSLLLVSGDSGYIESDGALTAITPISPIFMVLPTLFAQQKTSLPLDILIELSQDDDTCALSEDIWRKFAPCVCNTNGDDCFQLDLDKMDKVLDAYVAALPVPKSLAAQYERLVLPLNPNEPANPDLLSQARRLAGVSLLSSWLPEEISLRLRKRCNFEALEKEAAKIQQAKAQVLAVQSLQNGRTNSSCAKTSKRAAPAPKTRAPARQVLNNRSVLDMFKQASKSK